jgi:hypothetical protein
MKVNALPPSPEARIMNLLAAIFLQVTIIRAAVGLALTLAFVLTLGTAGGGPFSSKRERYYDPAMARASDDWRAAPTSKHAVSSKSDDAVEAAISACMADWDAKPLQERDEFGRALDTSAAARDTQRPIIEARCRRSARYR